MRKLPALVLLLILFSHFAHAQNSIECAGKPKIITQKDQYFIRPVWSPDGKKIAFTGSNQKGIWYLDLETDKIIPVVDKEGAGYQFSWSPDGEYIAYRARYTENRKSKMAIEIVHLSSKKIEALTPQQKRLGLPQWGNDNSKLFVTRNEKLQFIKTGIPATKTLKKSLPVRKELAFTRYGKLHTAAVVNPDSLESLLPVTEVINPYISPFGKFIACEEYGGDLIILNLESNKKISLGDGHRPFWSPDENWICYMVTEDDGHQYLSSDIYISSFDGKKQFNLTDSEDRFEMNPSWSPDGNTIAFDDYKTGVIYLQNLEYKLSEK